ncbi:hypothetical protein Pelo_18487 [Pelomyxa schiedti]|nr:hypothetical protein Pelo_18487 [Pelomyxa schiedti]
MREAAAMARATNWSRESRTRHDCSIGTTDSIELYWDSQLARKGPGSLYHRSGQGDFAPGTGNICAPLCVLQVLFLLLCAAAAAPRKSLLSASAGRGGCNPSWLVLFSIHLYWKSLHDTSAGRGVL